MSGHSKWSTIKRKKGALDAKRGKIFTKLIRELQTAARIGGGDADSNPRLRLAIDKAKTANMPKDNIQRAIQKGIGGGDSESFEEIVYEGYGPGGTAIMIETLSDNKNRTVGDLRYVALEERRQSGRLGLCRVPLREARRHQFRPRGHRRRCAARGGPRGGGRKTWSRARTAARSDRADGASRGP